MHYWRRSHQLFFESKKSLKIAENYTHLKKDEKDYYVEVNKNKLQFFSWTTVNVQAGQKVNRRKQKKTGVFVA